MREALGLTSARGQRDGGRPKPQAVTFNAPLSNRGGGDVPKRRFVRDGEVQVTMVSGGRGGEPAPQRRSQPLFGNERPDQTQAALRAEKAAREKAEWALKEAREAVQDLRTKLGQLGLARDQALEAARRAEVSQAALAQQLETVRAQLSAEVSARARAERAARLLEPEAPVPAPPSPEPVAKRGPGRPRKLEPAPAVAKRKPGRPRIEKEPEPVKWWVPKRKPRAAKA